MCEKITGGGNGPNINYKLLGWCALILIILVGIVVFLVFVILRPSRPSFNLQDVTVYNFNVSTTPPYSLTINMQATLSSTNPNARIGIEYQPLDLYATYRDQQISLASLLPPTYQGHKEAVVWSPFLSGHDVPISPYWEQSLAQDLNVGALRMNFKLEGNLKFKVGIWRSSKYHLYVRCPANIKFGDMTINGGTAVGPSVIKGQPVDQCSVETAL